MAALGDVAEPTVGSIIRFHMGNPYGGYYFAAVNRGRYWKTTSLDKNPPIGEVPPDHWGPILRYMSWRQIVAERPRAQIAVEWDAVQPQDDRLRNRLAVVRFKTGRYRMAAILSDEVYPNGEWHTTVDNPRSPAFGFPAWTALTRGGVRFEIAVRWIDLRLDRHPDAAATGRPYGREEQLWATKRRTYS